MESAVIFALGVIVIAVGLMLSIALHEWGHFAPAKKFGVYIPQFMIGFGPTLFSRRRGETEFGVKAIPLGGYVAMAGMYAPGSPDSAGGTSTTGFLDRVIGDEPVVSDVSTNAEDIDRRSFYRLPLIQRITIMLGGPLMNLVIALVLYAVLGYQASVLPWAVCPNVWCRLVKPAVSVCRVTPVPPGLKRVCFREIALCRWRGRASRAGLA